MFELKLENIDGTVIDINDGVKYEVIRADGFDPPSASLFTSKSPNKKGLKHNGSTLNERIIVIQIKLLGNVEENRNELYTWTYPELYSKIYFRNSAKSVFCEGYVETCEVDMFSNNEIVNVEIVCGDPYLKDINEILVEISNVLNQFVFPFSITQEAFVNVSSKNPDGTNAVVKYNRGIPFSTLKENNLTNVFNAGAETGAQFLIRCISPINSILIFNDKDTSQRFNIVHSFGAGWQIVIDTERSPRTCKAFSPDGKEENSLRYVKGNPTWFMLKKGMNTFGCVVDPASANVEVEILFTNKYLGV